MEPSAAAAKRPLSANMSNREMSNAKEAKMNRKDPAHAPPKQTNNFVQSPPSKKKGAISMFEEPEEVPAPAAPAEAKRPAPPNDPQALFERGAPHGGPPGRPPPRAPPPRPPGAAAMVRTPRPLPPRTNPPGIPPGQPLPPGDRQGAVGVKPPAPVRPPPRGPAGGRAPPKEEPVDIGERLGDTYKPEPPTSEPPLLRIKRPKVDENPLKRREKEMPEYESSDDDEDDPNFVKQPLPFGVLKQEVPKTSLQLKEEAAKAKERERAAAAAVASRLASAETVGGGGNDEAEAIMLPDSPESRAATAQSMASGAPMSRPSSSESVTSMAMTAMTRTDAPSDALRDNRMSGFVPKPPPNAEGTTVVESMDLGKHFDDSKLASTLNRGRLCIRCVEGHDIRRKDDQDHIPRNDPFIKFRLGAAERHPWKQTEAKRKQDGNPKFDDELVTFDITDPAQFVFQENLELYIELWNKSTLRNELVGSVNIGVVRFMKQPFVKYLEKVPIYYPGATRTPMKVK